MGQPGATQLLTELGLAGCKAVAEGAAEEAQKMALCVYKDIRKRCTYREKWSHCLLSLENSHTAPYVLDLPELRHGLS
jgi:hypothetical protein